MSYGFRVTVKDNVAIVDVLTAYVPDGTWNVNGHSGGGTQSVGVLATDSAGEQLGASCSTYAKVDVDA
jgi:hypothetical protein